jgi:predicted TIM-barrel fold metal-dependent hydrolase
MMDACEIDRACTSVSRFLRFDFSLGNEITRKAIELFPDRLIGFCTVNPRYSEKSTRELDKCLGSWGFRGIKIHISHTGLRYNHPLYLPIYEKAQEYRVPVLAHTFSRPDVLDLLDAARKYQDVDFMVGHSGGYVWADCLDDIAPVENAYFDICCSCPDLGRVESFVSAGGATRVLFGTDLPLLDPSVCASQVAYAEISEKEKELIFSDNILRILGEEQK